MTRCATGETARTCQAARPTVHRAEDLDKKGRQVLGSEPLADTVVVVGTRLVMVAEETAMAVMINGGVAAEGEGAGSYGDGGLWCGGGSGDDAGVAVMVGRVAAVPLLLVAQGTVTADGIRPKPNTHGSIKSCRIDLD